MNFIKLLIRSLVIVGIVGFSLGDSPLTRAADTQAPTVIADGFNLWAKKGASYAFDVWRMGGVLENDSKPASLSSYFGRMGRTVGNYRSYEVIDTKKINPSSEIVYLSVNFERVAIYGRFLLYRADKGWVVQNMDFSPKPEAMMPWLAFAGGEYGQ